MKFSKQFFLSKTVLWSAVIVAMASIALFAQGAKNVKPLEFGVLDYSGDESASALLARMRPTESRFMILAEKKSNVTAKEGSRFYIPKDAFVYPDGSRVRGVVEFHVKEVITDIDFALSKVPLITTDEYGNEVYFQSAGMFNVGASAKGKDLKLAPGKQIGVHFPNVVPGDEFFVYKMDASGKWQKHGHNQELIAQSGPTGGRQPIMNEGGIGVREYNIDGLTWWNFDQPYPDTACLKGKIGDPEKVFTPPYQVTSIGMNYKGSFSLNYSDLDFKIVAHTNKRAKVMITDAKGNIGISDVIKIGKRRGHFKYKEGEKVKEISRETRRPTGRKYKNYCYQIGTIDVKKVPKDIIKNKEAFSDYLGLNREYYQVSYPPPPPPPPPPGQYNPDSEIFDEGRSDTP